MGQGDLSVREALLDAALALLRLGGPSGATARAICDRVGVGAPALYHYFGSLERLHHAAVDLAFEQVAACYAPVGEDGDPYASMCRSWELLMAFARENPHLYGLINQQLVKGEMPPLARRAFDQLVADLALLNANRPLRKTPEQAAAILWAGGLGAADYVASAVLGDVPGITGAEVGIAIRGALMASLLG